MTLAAKGGETGKAGGSASERVGQGWAAREVRDAASASGTYWQGHRGGGIALP